MKKITIVKLKYYNCKTVPREIDGEGLPEELLVTLGEDKGLDR